MTCMWQPVSGPIETVPCNLNYNHFYEMVLEGSLHILDNVQVTWREDTLREDSSLQYETSLLKNNSLLQSCRKQVTMKLSGIMSGSSCKKLRHSVHEFSYHWRYTVSNYITLHLSLIWYILTFLYLTSNLIQPFDWSLYHFTVVILANQIICSINAAVLFSAKCYNTRLVTEHQ